MEMQWTLKFGRSIILPRYFSRHNDLFRVPVINYSNKKKTRPGIYSIFCEECNGFYALKNKQVCQSKLQLHTHRKT